MTDNPQKPRRWASRAQAAQHLGVHPTTIDRYAQTGKITKYVIDGGGISRYDLDQLDQLLHPIDHGAQASEPGDE